MAVARPGGRARHHVLAGRLSALYCAPDAFRIEEVPVKAALRLQPEDAYLSQDPEYMVVRMIGSVVPPGEPVFAISQGGQSYLPRELLVGYESASNEVLQDILWTPVVRNASADTRPQIRFCAARAAQIAGGSNRQPAQQSMVHRRIAHFQRTEPNCRAIRLGGSPRIRIPGKSSWLSTTVR